MSGRRSSSKLLTSGWRAIRSRIVELALGQTELSLRELAVRFTDAQGYFVLEATVYRLLKAHDLITNLAFIVIKAAKEFTDPWKWRWRRLAVTKPIFGTDHNCCRIPGPATSPAILPNGSMPGR